MNSTGTQMWFLARGRHGTHSSSRSSSSSCRGIKEAVEAHWGCGSRAGGRALSLPADDDDGVQRGPKESKES
jgi:hypothetical protein